MNGNTRKDRGSFGALVRKYPHTEYAAECAAVLARLGIGNSEAGDPALDRAARAPAGN